MKHKNLIKYQIHLGGNYNKKRSNGANLIKTKLNYEIIDFKVFQKKFKEYLYFLKIQNESKKYNKNKIKGINGLILLGEVNNIIIKKGLKFNIPIFSIQNNSSSKKIGQYNLIGNNISKRSLFYYNTLIKLILKNKI